MDANPQMLQQAQQLASKYGNDKNALKQALPLIKQMGGADVINKAMQKLNAHPMAKMALNGMLGGNIDNIVKELEQRPQALPQPQPTGSFRDQLKKYRYYRQEAFIINNFSRRIYHGSILRSRK